MKRFIAIVSLLMIPSLAFCQYFELAPNGMVSSTENEKKFVVLEFPEKNQTELFDLAHSYIVSKYSDA